MSSTQKLQYKQPSADPHIRWTLVMYFYIGDEDGPSLMLGLKKYAPGKRILYFNINDNNYPDFAVDGDFLYILANYYVVDIIEIYDWYDYYTNEEIKKLQYVVDNRPVNILPQNDNDNEQGLFIMVPYNEEPVKYVLPLHIFEQIKPNFAILHEPFDDDCIVRPLLYNKKQNILNVLHPYKIDATVYEIIFKNRIVAYEYITFDNPSDCHFKY